MKLFRTLVFFSLFTLRALSLSDRTFAELQCMFTQTDRRNPRTDWKRYGNLQFTLFQFHYLIPFIPKPPHTLLYLHSPLPTSHILSPLRFPLSPLPSLFNAQSTPPPPKSPHPSQPPAQVPSSLPLPYPTYTTPLTTSPPPHLTNPINLENSIYIYPSAAGYAHGTKKKPETTTCDTDMESDIPNPEVIAHVARALLIYLSFV